MHCQACGLRGWLSVASCSSDPSSCSGRTDYCPKEPVEAQAARQTGDQNPTPAKLEPQEEVQAKPHQTPEPQVDACDGKADSDNRMMNDDSFISMANA